VQRFLSAAEPEFAVYLQPVAVSGGYLRPQPEDAPFRINKFHLMWTITGYYFFIQHKKNPSKEMNLICNK
jgi:hypothetical protein